MSKVKKYAPVVAVLNLKGGVGKTTISANVFRVLFEKLQASTLLIDIDPQFNLTQTLFTREEYEKLKAKSQTVLSVMESPQSVDLFTVNVDACPPPLPKNIGIPRHFSKTTPVEQLMIIPGDFGLVKYSLMDDNKKLTAVRKRFLQFIQKAREQFKIVCIDCNPSSSFLTQCALYACTHILVPVRPDKYSILGLELLYDYVDKIPAIKPKPSFIVLLNDIPRKHYQASIEAELRTHAFFGKRTLVKKIYHSRLLYAQPDYTGFATDKKASWGEKLEKNISEVVDELAAKLGITL